MYTKKSKITALILLLIGELIICIDMQELQNIASMLVLSYLAILNIFVGYLMLFKRGDGK